MNKQYVPKSISLKGFLVCVVALACSTTIIWGKPSVCYQLEGAKIVSDDGEYLGTLESRYSSENIFNQYGSFGSKYSSTSIWNRYGTYGSKYSSQSPFNSYSTSPTRIIHGNTIIGYLTVNKFMTGAVNPYAVAVQCYAYDDFTDD